jgi:CRP/FNR family transcriptional regulator, cyclic AMP receptor protein
MTDVITHLRGTPLFAELDDEALARVAALCQSETVAADTHLFHEGDAGDRLYLITSGAVRISRQIPGSGEEALTVLRPGQVFGEMAVFDRTERSTDAIAQEATTLLTIQRDALETLLVNDPALARVVLWAFVRVLSGRLRATNDSLRSFLAMSMF